MDNEQRMQLEVHTLTMKLIAADRVMREVDRLVEAQLLNSRSGVADARLNYGQPFEYEFDTNPVEVPE